MRGPGRAAVAVAVTSAVPQVERVGGRGGRPARVLRGRRAGAHAAAAGALGAAAELPHALQRPLPVSAVRPTTSPVLVPPTPSDAARRPQLQVLGVRHVARGGGGRPAAGARRPPAGQPRRAARRLHAASAGKGLR